MPTRGECPLSDRPEDQRDPPAGPLRRGAVEKGGLTFRSRFLDFTRRVVLHCQMMNHEDTGMMQVVEVCD